MRVVWVLADSAVRTGSVLAGWAAPLLARAGHEVEILPMSATAEPVAEFSVPVLEPPVRTGWGHNLQVSGVLRRAFSRYDRVVVDQTLDLEIRAILSKAALSRRGRLMMLAHVPLTQYLAARGEHEIGRLRRTITGLYPRLDRVIAVSAGVGSDLVMEFNVEKSRLSVLAPPVPVGRLETEAKTRPGAWPFPVDQTPVIVAMGRLEHLKGIAVLIQAMKLLQDRGRPARLLVLGDGPARAELTEQARAMGLDAAFPGWVPDVGAWLGAADIFVAPQYFDGAGWDLYAAMSVGLPVIATNAPVASEEILARGKRGRIVSIGEPVALVDALVEWLETPKLSEGPALLGMQRARGVDAERIQSEWVEAVCS